MFMTSSDIMLSLHMMKTRILIQLDKEQLDSLRKIHHKTGASIAEIVRRAIALYLKKEKS